MMRMKVKNEVEVS